MKKILFTAAFLMGVLLSFFGSPPQAQALTDEIYTGIVPESGLQVNCSGGSLTSIEYFVSSSGHIAKKKTQKNAKLVVRNYLVLPK